MKCPTCKKSELQTRRTIKNGNSVNRERFCPRCKKRMETIERFTLDINDIESSFKIQINELRHKKDAAEQKYDYLIQELTSFKTLLDRLKTTS